MLIYLFIFGMTNYSLLSEVSNGTTVTEFGIFELIKWIKVRVYKVIVRRVFYNSLLNYSYKILYH